MLPRIGGDAYHAFCFTCARLARTRLVGMTSPIGRHRPACWCLGKPFSVDHVFGQYVYGNVLPPHLACLELTGDEDDNAPLTHGVSRKGHIVQNHFRVVPCVAETNISKQGTIVRSNRCVRLPEGTYHIAKRSKPLDHTLQRLKRHKPFGVSEQRGSDYIAQRTERSIYLTDRNKIYFS